MFDIAVRLKYFSIAAVADNMSCWHLVILFTEWENSPLNSCLVPLFTEAAEQKCGWGGWCERVRSSRLSARSVHARRSRIGETKAHLAPPPSTALGYLP